MKDDERELVPRRVFQGLSEDFVSKYYTRT